jgi:hypothetical protein
MSAANENTKAGGEGAQAPSSVLDPTQMKFVKEIGLATARTMFAERGNPTSFLFTEADLAVICAGAAGAAIKLVMDQAKKDLDSMKQKTAGHAGDLQVQVIELFLPDTDHPIFQRPVIVHIGKDGTLSFLNRATMTQSTLVEALMPVYSVETEEQAKSLQVVFGKLQYRDNTREPGKPWYILNRLPDGKLLMDRNPPYLQISDLPAITKQMHDWFEGMYGKKPENVRAS